MPILAFTPAKYDVIWDGVSTAAATFGLTVPGPYSASAYRVFDRAGEYTDVATGTVLETYSRGDRFFTVSGNTVTHTVTAVTDQTLTVTAVSQNATVVFSSLTPAGGFVNSSYAYLLRVTSGNPVVAGRIDVRPINAYESAAQGSVRYVTNVTAT